MSRRTCWWLNLKSRKWVRCKGSSRRTTKSMRTVEGSTSWSPAGDKVVTRKPCSGKTVGPVNQKSTATNHLLPVMVIRLPNRLLKVHEKRQIMGSKVWQLLISHHWRGWAIKALWGCKVQGAPKTFRMSRRASANREPRVLETSNSPKCPRLRAHKWFVKRADPGRLMEPNRDNLCNRKLSYPTEERINVPRQLNFQNKRPNNKARKKLRVSIQAIWLTALRMWWSRLMAIRTSKSK